MLATFPEALRASQYTKQIQITSAKPLADYRQKTQIMLDHSQACVDCRTNALTKTKLLHQTPTLKLHRSNPMGFLCRVPGLN